MTKYLWSNEVVNFSTFSSFSWLRRRPKIILLSSFPSFSPDPSLDHPLSIISLVPVAESSSSFSFPASPNFLLQLVFFDSLTIIPSSLLVLLTIQTKRIPPPPLPPSSSQGIVAVIGTNLPSFLFHVFSSLPRFRRKKETTSSPPALREHLSSSLLPSLSVLNAERSCFEEEKVLQRETRLGIEQLYFFTAIRREKDLYSNGVTVTRVACNRKKERGTRVCVSVTHSFYSFLQFPTFPTRL